MPVVRSGRDFDRLIETWTEEMRRAFLQSIQNVRDSIEFNDLVRKIEMGDVEGALRAVGLNPTDFRPVDKVSASAFETGGTHALQDVNRVNRAAKVVNKAVVKFNVRNPQAERWLATHSSNRVTDIMDDQRKLVRAHLAEGLAKGMNPRGVALELAGRVGPAGARTGGVLGLTSSQAEFVRNYRDELERGSKAALGRKLRDRRFDATVLKAAEAGEAVPASLVEKMVMSYANRLLLNRAEGIARSETMAALHEGQQQGMEQLAQGGVDRENIVGIWHITRDKRTRDSHRSMEGQRAQLGEMFTTGDGNELEFPGDPNGEAGEIVNCRCWREFRVDFLAGIR